MQGMALHLMYGVPGGLAMSDPMDHASANRCLGAPPILFARLRPATSPITVTAGGPMPASLAVCAILCNSAVTECWLGSPPSAMTAAGVVDGSPAPASFSAIRDRLRTPIKMTMVVPLRANAVQIGRASCRERGEVRVV